MRKYNEVDIRFYGGDVDGDFFVDETGDLQITSHYESARQDMTNRLRTQKGEWRTHQHLGADLELLEGEPNTRNTGERAVSMCYEALTNDNRFDMQDVHVRAVPTSIESLEVYALLDSDENGDTVVNQPINL